MDMDPYQAGWDAFQQFLNAAHSVGDDDAGYDDLPHLARELKRLRDKGQDYMQDFADGWGDAASLAEEQDLANA